MADPFLVVFALYPRVTQLDFTGPYEVFWRAPGAQCILASAAGGDLTADGGIVHVIDVFAADALVDLREYARLFPGKAAGRIRGWRLRLALGHDIVGNSA